jgi:hypothetical protein
VVEWDSAGIKTCLRTSSSIDSLTCQYALIGILPFQVGDNLIQVDGVVVDTWRLKELAGLLLGSAGSEVKLSFRNQQDADYEVYYVLTMPLCTSSHLVELTY